MLVAGVISMVYLLSKESWEQKFAFFMFMWSFASIFKLSSGQTSLFMILRLSIVLCFVFKEMKKINFLFITILIAFFTYCVVLSELYHTGYVINVINLLIWIFVGYAMVNTISFDTITPIVRSFSNGIIITGIIGLFIEELPQIKEMCNTVYTIAEDGAHITRYAGFWSDPNYFAVLLVMGLWFIYSELNSKRISVVEFLSRSAMCSFLGLMTMSKSSVLLLLLFWAYVLISKNDIKTAPKVSIFFSMLIAAGFFLWKNPYWLGDILYRFFGSGNTIDSETLTTGRTGLWQNYFGHMLDNFSWVFGEGINAKLVNRMASHNMLINLIHNIGIFGSVIYVLVLRTMYASVKGAFVRKNIKSSLANLIFIMLIVAMMFLDGLLFESFYYLLPLCYVYILGINYQRVEVKYEEITGDVVI